MRIGWTEVSPIYQRNLHRLQPARRNSAHVGQNPVGGRAVHGNEIVPTAAAEQGRIRQRDGFYSFDASQMFGNLLPKFYRLKTLCHGVENKNTVRRKAHGLV